MTVKKVTGQVETVRLAENNDVQLVIDNKVVSLRFVERVSDKPIGETNPEDAKKDDQKSNGRRKKLQIHKECPYVMIKSVIYKYYRNECNTKCIKCNFK